MLFIEVAIVVALILINGLLALAELAIVSSRRARLQVLVDRNVIGSRRPRTRKRSRSVFVDRPDWYYLGRRPVGRVFRSHVGAASCGMVCPAGPIHRYCRGCR